MENARPHQSAAELCFFQCSNNETSPTTLRIPMVCNKVKTCPYNTSRVSRFFVRPAEPCCLQGCVEPMCHNCVRVSVCKIAFAWVFAPPKLGQNECNRGLKKKTNPKHCIFMHFLFFAPRFKTKVFDNCIYLQLSLQVTCLVSAFPIHRQNACDIAKPVKCSVSRNSVEKKIKKIKNNRNPRKHTNDDTNLVFAPKSVPILCCVCLLLKTYHFATTLFPHTPKGTSLYKVQCFVWGWFSQQQANGFTPKNHVKQIHALLDKFHDCRDSWHPCDCPFCDRQCPVQLRWKEYLGS